MTIENNLRNNSTVLYQYYWPRLENVGFYIDDDANQEYVVAIFKIRYHADKS